MVSASCTPGLVWIYIRIITPLFFVSSNGRAVRVAFDGSCGRARPLARPYCFVAFLVPLSISTSAEEAHEQLEWSKTKLVYLSWDRGGRTPSGEEED